MEFQLATNKAPSFKISPGSIHGMLNVRANVVVNKADGSKLPVFYIDIVSHTNRIFLPYYLLFGKLVVLSIEISNSLNVSQIDMLYQKLYNLSIEKKFNFLLK